MVLGFLLLPIFWSSRPIQCVLCLYIVPLLLLHLIPTFMWDRCTITLRISTQALVFPAAEYCAPVWSRSPHVKKVDVAINSSLRTISVLPVLAGIAPAGLRRKAATLALARKAVKDDWHILHDTTKNEVPPCRLKSRKPYNKEAQEMLSVIPEDRTKDAWIAATWKKEWEASGPTRVHRHVSDP